MAERVGFEPTERFPVHSISSAANSTTLAPLRHFRLPIADCQLAALFEGIDLDKDQSKINNRKSAMSWRRGWDSNPRWALTHSGFRDRCTNPLCDLSTIKAKGKSKKAKIRTTAMSSCSCVPRSALSLFLLPFYFCLLVLKNSCINSRHSFSKMPLMTSTR